MSDTLYDIRQEQYPTVIREMIRHEDNVTNHRIMWMIGLLRARCSLNIAVATTLSIILSAVTLSRTCVLIGWSQSKDDQIAEE